MLFHTPAFLIFLTVIVATVALVRHRTGRKLVLLAGSYFFYMSWSAVMVLPLLFTTFLDYSIGRLLESEDRPGRRRTLLTLSIVANLGLLAFFKYFNFFVENAHGLLHLAGIDFALPLLRVVLPIGISFYTFHTMSYTIDVYRREIPACRSALDFALFITFFPVLVAGPILRAKQFLPEIARGARLSISPGVIMLFVRGLAKKVLVADNVSPFVDAVFTTPQRWPSFVIWVATIAFAVQIYCDFSGYSDMARALAALFGYEIPINFDRPYFARNASEFWKRWHISLSTWLRDYLYIPLGGNRQSQWKTYRNLMVTMTLGGLWHGASWNFILWGGMHGLLLIVHRAWRTSIRSTADTWWSLALSWAVFQYCVLLTWIAFRNRSTDAMLAAMRKFVVFDFDFSPLHIGLAGVYFTFTASILVVFFALHVWGFLRGDLDHKIAALPRPQLAAAAILIGTLFVLLWPTMEKPFIYFQF